MKKKILQLFHFLLLLALTSIGCQKKSDDIVSNTSEQLGTSAPATSRDLINRNSNTPPYLQILKAKNRNVSTLPSLATGENCTGGLNFTGVTLPGACYTLDIYVTDVCVLTVEQFDDAFEFGGAQSVGAYKTPSLTLLQGYTDLNETVWYSFPIFNNKNYWFVASIWPNEGLFCSNGCCADLPPLASTVNFQINNGSSQISNYAVQDAFVLLDNNLPTASGPHRMICAGTPIWQIQACTGGGGGHE